MNSEWLEPTTYQSSVPLLCFLQLLRWIPGYEPEDEHRRRIQSCTGVKLTVCSHVSQMIQIYTIKNTQDMEIPEIGTICWLIFEYFWVTGLDDRFMMDPNQRWKITQFVAFTAVLIHDMCTVFLYWERRCTFCFHTTTCIWQLELLVSYFFLTLHI